MSVSVCLSVFMSVCLHDSPLTYLNKRSAVAEMGDRLATIDMGRGLYGRRQDCVHKPRKWGDCCAPFRGGAGFPFNTMWPGPRPTSVPSGIVIHRDPSNRLATVHQRYRQTDRQTDRQDRQLSDSLGQTVLEAMRPFIKLL